MFLYMAMFCHLCYIFHWKQPIKPGNELLLPHYLTDTCSLQLIFSAQTQSNTFFAQILQASLNLSSILTFCPMFRPGLCLFHFEVDKYFTLFYLGMKLIVSNSLYQPQNNLFFIACYVTSHKIKQSVGLLICHSLT